MAPGGGSVSIARDIRPGGEQGGVSDTWIGVDGAAAYPSVAKDSIHRWIERCGLPVRQVGRLLCFKLSAVDTQVEAGSEDGGRPAGPLTIRSSR